MRSWVLFTCVAVVVGGAVAGPPIADNFDVGIGPQWSFANLGTGPAKGAGPSEGKAEVVDGQLLLTSNGWDVWEDEDGMALLYQQVTGDFDVALHIVAFDGNLDGDPNAANATGPNGGNEWEKAGIVFRQGLDPGAPYVSAMISRSHGLRTQYRLDWFGSTNRARRGNDGSGPKAGWWVRLIRQGNTFQQLCAETLAGPWLEADDHLDRALPDGILEIDDSNTADPPVLGIMYTPHSTDNNAVLTGTGIVDDFVVFSPIGIFDAHADVEWQGNLGAPGNAIYDPATDTYTIWGSGADVWTSTGDNFHFVYKEWSGDFTLTADVSVSGGLPTQSWIKAMLMARQSLDGDALYCSTRVRRDGQYSIQWRDGPGFDTGGSTPGDLRVTGLNPGRHRFERVGDTFCAYYQSNGEWIQVHCKDVILEDPILLGFGVTAHDYGEIAVGTFSNVTLTAVTAVDWELR